MYTAQLIQFEKKLSELQETQRHNDIIIRNRREELKRQCFFISYKELLVNMKEKYSCTLPPKDPARSIFKQEIFRLKEQINRLEKTLEEDVEFVKFLKLRRTYFDTEMRRIEYKIYKQEKIEELWIEENLWMWWWRRWK